MTNRTDADFLQVLLCQAREDPFVNLVLAERSLVSFEAKAPQPTSEVHDGALGLRRSISLQERSGEVLGAVGVRRG